MCEGFSKMSNTGELYELFYKTFYWTFVHLSIGGLQEEEDFLPREVLTVLSSLLNFSLVLAGLIENDSFGRWKGISSFSVMSLDFDWPL